MLCLIQIDSISFLFSYHLFLSHNKNKYINISLYITPLLQSRINTMPNSNPIFIPFSKLNSGKKCITCSLQNFTGKVHITLDGVLFCSTDYDGFEEDLEQAFDSFGLGVGVPPVGVVAIGIINDNEAAAAAAAADRFDGNEELVVGETLNGGHGGHGDDSNDSNDSNDGDDSNEDNDTDDDTVTDLPSSKLQFDSDDDSYDEDQHFSQQASFFN